MARERIQLKERARQRLLSLFDFDGKMMSSGRAPGIHDEVQLDLFSRSYDGLIGVDEVGRGCLAGPVMAAAVMFPGPVESYLEDLIFLDDSKRVTGLRRERLARKIRERACIGVGFVSHREIDEINILNASLLAMKRAVLQLVRLFRVDEESTAVAVDGCRNLDNLPMRQIAVPGGDGRSAAIAAASIIAKVSRDNFMTHMDSEFPEYGWSENKGYPSRAHIAALEKLGPTSFHRQTFKW